SSDVCSADLAGELGGQAHDRRHRREHVPRGQGAVPVPQPWPRHLEGQGADGRGLRGAGAGGPPVVERRDARDAASVGRHAAGVGVAAAGGPAPGRTGSGAAAGDQSLPPSPAAAPRRRGRILDSLLLLLFLVGVIPLVGTSFHLVSKSREILELDQKTIQLDKARSLSQQVSTYLKGLQSQTIAIARTLELDTPPDQFAARVSRIREVDGLKRYVEGTSNFVSVSVVDARGFGARS